MGQYVNPGKRRFEKDTAAEIYVDKTELIGLLNRRIGSKDVFLCNSRPRRFGKSMAVNMLAAYYDKGCDARELFSHYKIARDSSFEKHLNKYDIICIDVQWVKSIAGGAEYVVAYLNKIIVDELRQEYSQVDLSENITLSEALSKINKETGAEFGILIDEWDCIIRDDSRLLAVQEEYIAFLRGLFKGLQPSEYICFAYMTGILPIKKYNTQSALNNFEEYSMLNPSVFAKYIGFTEAEVFELCQKYGRNFDHVRLWYDGYLLGDEHVYNPRAVVNLMLTGEYQSHWSQTGTYESIRTLIDRNFAGLKDSVIAMLSGGSVLVDIRTFSNDMLNFENADDILTALIHMGYLAYDRHKKAAYIPNEEIRSEFVYATRKIKWTELDKLLEQSQVLLEATLDMNEESVAEIVEQFHMDYAAAIQYNNENALSSVLTMAYIVALKYYYKPIREMPAGRGYADIVFIPKRDCTSMPALLIELKWDRSPQQAIKQIKEKRYANALRGYAGEVLLVGINYSKGTKQHECKIEKIIL